MLTYLAKVPVLEGLNFAHDFFLSRPLYNTMPGRLPDDSSDRTGVNFGTPIIVIFTLRTATTTMSDHPSRRDQSSMLFSPENSMAVSCLPSPTSSTLEMEVNWDSRVIRSELRLAIHILSQRGLKLAQKWASEQLMGLHRGGGAVELSTDTIQIFEEYMSPTLDDVVLYAKSLMDLGEYVHAASVLSLPSKGKLVLTMTDPLPNLSPFGIYLRAYALYLAGERCKEEEMMELQR